MPRMSVPPQIDGVFDVLVPLGFGVVTVWLAYRIVSRGHHWLEECSRPERRRRED